MKPVPASALMVGIPGLILLVLFRQPLSLVGLLMLAGAAWAWWRAGRQPSPKHVDPVKDVQAVIAPLQYQSFYKNTAIGIDPAQRIVHLYQNKQYRAYAFSDIRSWNTNIQTGGKFIGGGGDLGTALAMTSANIRASKANAANTGLFIEVRDIDFPTWKIDFPEKGMQQSHARWMEILRQHINES
ncbi:DUF4755 domain-containing protein [Massilia sp. DWR3-1-1]|uniref:DUF4755 domain-containing protein n=1 Tax=Massilia sp. DWR3-1-1 TaxID=2804559 RepID=UPI003CF94426